MDDYAEVLKGERSNPTAKLMEILVSNYDDYDRIVAIEGVDDKPFYFDFMNEYCRSEDLLYVDCGGKESLLKLKRIVDMYSWGAAPTVIYLCDKDFDDYLGKMEDGIFYTKYYSIESYFLDEKYVEHVIGKYSKAHITQKEKKMLISKFRENFAIMLKMIRPICALMFTLRNRGLHPDFDTLTIEKLFDLGKNFPAAKRNRMRLILDELKVDGNFSHTEMIVAARKFKLDDYRFWVRGKLGLQVLRAAYKMSSYGIGRDFFERCASHNYMTSDCLKYSKVVVGDIPELRSYCDKISRASI